MILGECGVTHASQEVSSPARSESRFPFIDPHLGSAIELAILGIVWSAVVFKPPTVCKKPRKPPRPKECMTHPQGQAIDYASTFVYHPSWAFLIVVDWQREYFNGIGLLILASRIIYIRLLSWAVTRSVSTFEAISKVKPPNFDMTTLACPHRLSSLAFSKNSCPSHVIRTGYHWC